MITGLLGTILIIGFLVFVHELGHFLAARRSDVQVDEFAFGFGPKIASIVKTTKGFNIQILKRFKFQIPFKGKSDETEYRINVLPLGGYVKMLGEEQGVDDPRSYSMKSARSRLLILSAGVMMNLIVGILIYYALLVSSGFITNIPMVVEGNYKFIGTQAEERVGIYGVSDGSPAQEAGIEPRDLVVSIEGQKIDSIEEVSEVVDKNLDKNLDIVVERGPKRDKVEFHVLARKDHPEGEGSLGIIMFESLDLNYGTSLVHKVFSGISNSFNIMSFQLTALGNLVKLSFETRDASPVTENVTGIVGIFSITSDVITYGTLRDVMELTALLTLSLAFMNILPLPMLDGGHISLLALEKVRGGKKLSSKWEDRYMKSGLLFLVGLTILITIKDVLQFGIFDSIKDIF